MIQPRSDTTSDTTRTGTRRRPIGGPIRLGLVVIVAAVLTGLAWYLVSPLFIDRRVSEELPAVAAPVTAARATLGPASITQPAPCQQPAASVQQPSAGAAAPRPSGQQEAGTPVGGQAGAPPLAQGAAPVSDGPVATRRGSFGGVDQIHKGEGQATLYRRPDGSTILRLEDFRVTNGPDLYVYLSGHPAPRTSAQLHEGIGYEVAVLKGNVGDQNYELPADLDLASAKSVVIYCKRFTTVFSTAELQPA